MWSDRGRSISRLIAAALVALGGAVALPAARAAYVIEPDILKEYRELKKEAAKHPDSAAANFEYAVCLAYVGKIEESRSALKKTQALDPGFAEKALPGYAARHARDPANLKIKFRLGFLYYFDNQYDRALKIFSEIADRRPAGQLNAWALGYMGVIKSDQGKWDEAENLVRRALGIEADAYGLHAALAAALKEQGNLIPALREYFTALKDRREFEAYEKTLWQPSVAGTTTPDQ